MGTSPDIRLIEREDERRKKAAEPKPYGRRPSNFVIPRKSDRDEDVEAPNRFDQ